MKVKAFVQFFIVLMLPVILACSCSAEDLSKGPHACTQQETDLFLQDLEDNGQIDYSHECTGPKLPTPTPGLYIPVSDSKQPPCSMEWLSAADAPSYGPYSLDVSPQTGAMSYEFVITYPDGTQTSIISGSSKAILIMDDMPTGAYSVEIHALAFMSDEVCSIKAGFTKPGPGFALNASPECAMKFISPADGSELTIEGPVDFVWTQQPGAVSYLLDFVLPNGNHGMADPTTNLSKTMYMEAFQPGGTYTVFVKALNMDANMICQVSLSFTKPEYPQQLVILSHGNDDPDESPGAAPTEQPVFFPPIILLNFTPTPVVIK